jgi:Tol biopolymer transport system component
VVPYAPGDLHRMYLVSPQGGPPKPFQPDFGSWPVPGGVGPIWSPDGRFLMFDGARIGESGTEDWWIAPVDGGAAARVNGTESIPRRGIVQFPALWLPGSVILAAGTTIEGINLYRVSIRPGDREISGPPEPLTSGPGMKYVASVSTDGQLVLSDFTWITQVWSLELGAAGLPTSALRQLTRDAHQKIGLSLSRDGRKLAYSVYSLTGDQFRGEIRIQDLESGNESVPVLSTAGTVSLYPKLSRDGSVLVYRDLIDGVMTFLVRRIGETVSREICRDCWVYNVFSDPSFVLVETEDRLVRQDLATGTQVPVVEMGDRTLLDADLSSDDAWIVVSIGRSGEPVRFYAVPVRDTPASGSEWVLIDENSDYKARPRWSDSGDVVYYLSDRDGFLCIWGRRLDPAGKTPVGEPFPVFHAHRNGQMMIGPRGAWDLSVGAGRLAMNPAEVRGDIWKLGLEVD